MAPRNELDLIEQASGVGSFRHTPGEASWETSAQMAFLFGLDPAATGSDLAAWERAVHEEDLDRLRAAFAVVPAGGAFDVEFRVRHGEGRFRWLSCKGQSTTGVEGRTVLRGACFDVTERKGLEARLLELNQVLQHRVGEVREEAHRLELLNRIGIAVAAEHDIERLVQLVTEAGVELGHAQVGGFLAKAGADGARPILQTVSGASAGQLAGIETVLAPVLRDGQTLRVRDLAATPGATLPLALRSLVAVPVIARSDEVLGVLFLGHAQPNLLTPHVEPVLTALAAQAAVAIDNARLHRSNQAEIAARRRAEQDLQRFNQTLELRAEERARQLAASEMALEETERRFRLLVEGVNDYAIYMLDPTGKVVNWNAGAARIKGYRREEIVGRNFGAFYTAEDQRNGAPQRALDEASQTGKFEAEGWRVRKDGSRFWAGVVINPISGPAGELIGFAKITRDLTERRATEERAQQAQKMEGIGQLTGGVAHDFNNLLTIIIGNLESLQRGLGDGGKGFDAPRLLRLADNAMRGARRAEALTQRLLAFSRQQPLEPRPIDIGRLVSGMSDLLRRTLGEEVAVETVTGAGLWRALADPNQLELAILNLAVNARDAMSDGGKLTIETANVQLDARYAASQAEVAPGAYVMLSVTDNGSGMTPEVRARAFDPFFTTKDVGHGTGLGLSQVYGFVKQSRGHVKIYSEPGEGTTIKLYLPRVQAGAEEAADDQIELPAHGARHETVLVVEDDPDVRAYSVETLRELGYNVIEAETGPGALRLLQGGTKVQMLFTDVVLPGGMNGRQLAEEAQKLRPNLKVLFTTGYARSAIVHEGRLDPGVELITKPFTRAALSARLRDVIESGPGEGGDGGAPGAGGRRRVLLVEDEALIQMLAREYLEEAGFAVEAVGSAGEAMRALGGDGGGFAAVVADVGLPDRRGDALLVEIRAAFPTLPVLLATGHDTRALRAQHKDDARLGFVGKPYSERDLVDALARVGVRGK